MIIPSQSKSTLYFDKYKLMQNCQFLNLTTQDDAEDVVRQSLYCSRSSTFTRKFIRPYYYLEAVVVWTSWEVDLASAVHPGRPSAEGKKGGHLRPGWEAGGAQHPEEGGGGGGIGAAVGGGRRRWGQRQICLGKWFWVNSNHLKIARVKQNVLSLESLFTSENNTSKMDGALWYYNWIGLGLKSW